MKDGAVDSSTIIAGRVKWYDPVKGYGFIVPDEGDGDILAHANCVRASGRASLPEGARVRIEAARGERGWQAVDIVSVEAPRKSETNPETGDRDEAAGPIHPARVKWFDRAKGFGFLNLFGRPEDVFVHMEVLRRGGFNDLAPGEAVAARVAVGPRGLMAAEVRRWEDVADEAAEGGRRDG